MYRILIKDKFESAHYLTNYYEDGSDEPIHGHTFRVEILLESNSLKNGISLDFIPFEKKLKDIVLSLDHCLLNDHPYFQMNNPTAENIAHYIYNEMQRNMDNTLQSKEKIFEVKVWEGPDHYASYFPQ